MQHMNRNSLTVPLQVVHEQGMHTLWGAAANPGSDPLANRRPVPEVHAFLLLEFIALGPIWAMALSLNSRAATKIKTYPSTLSRSHGQLPSRDH